MILLSYAAPNYAPRPSGAECCELKPLIAISYDDVLMAH